LIDILVAGELQYHKIRYGTDQGECGALRMILLGLWAVAAVGLRFGPKTNQSANPLTWVAA
jgi:hypothetical protein